MITIENRTGIIALAAFFLSVGTLLFQIGLYFVGPDAKLVELDGVTILKFTPTPDQSYVALLAPVALANASNSPQPLMVKRYKAEIVLPSTKKSMSYEWHRRIGSIVETSSGIELNDQKSVRPFLVPPREIDADFFLFTGHNRPCATDLSIAECNVQNGFIEIPEFRLYILDMLRQNNVGMTIKIYADFDGHSSVDLSCNVKFDDYALIKLQKFQYVGLLCV